MRKNKEIYALVYALVKSGTAIKQLEGFVKTGKIEYVSIYVDHRTYKTVVRGLAEIIESNPDIFEPIENE